MHWRIKGVVQKVLSPMPGGAWLHYHLQRTFGGLRDFDGELDSKVDDWAIMVHHLRDAGLPLQGARLFEIGTGWYPTFPYACFLGGARLIHTVDLNRHLRRELMRACVQGLERHLARIAETAVVDPGDVRSRYRTLVAGAGTSADLERASLGTIRYAAPADATASLVEAGSVDAVFSNSVLEHVPAETVDALYREAVRILVPGGLMFHSVNCGDHYAYVDRSISQLNYLQFSDAQWRRWNNDFMFQNRLRAHVFVERAAQAGFEIALDTSIARPERLRELERIPVHEQFAHIPVERLCITSVDFIGRKPAASVNGRAARGA